MPWNGDGVEEDDDAVASQAAAVAAAAQVQEVDGAFDIRAALARHAALGAQRQAAADAARSFAAVHSAPIETRREAVYAMPGRRTVKLLRSLLRFWRLWEQKRGEPIGERGPTFDDVNAFIVFASGTRRTRCLVNPNIKGQQSNTLLGFVSQLCRHVLPTVYAPWADVAAGGMGKGELRAFREDLSAACRNIFSEARIDRLAHHAQAEAAAAAAAAAAGASAAGAASVSMGGGSAGASTSAAAAGLAAGRAAAEARRAQTEGTRTKVHAAEQDLCLARDGLACEGLRRNRSWIFRNSSPGAEHGSSSTPRLPDYRNPRVSWAGRIRAAAASA